MAKYRTLRLVLPADWQEIRPRTPREFRRTEPGGGVLLIALHPPLQSDPDQLLQWLQGFISENCPELQEVVHEEQWDVELGACAFSLRRSSQHGMVGLWVILAEVLVFATYTMGSPDVAEAEINDAIAILESAYFEDGTGPLATG